MLADLDIIVVTPTVIGMEFALALSDAADMLPGVIVGVCVKALADVLAGVLIAVVTCIGVEVLPDVNVNTLGAVMTAFNFNMPVPLEESILLC